MGLKVQAVSSWGNFVDSPRSMNDVVQCLWAHVSWGFVGLLCSVRMLVFKFRFGLLACIFRNILPSGLPVLDLVLWSFSLRMQRSNRIYRIGLLDLADTNENCKIRHVNKQSCKWTFSIREQVRESAMTCYDRLALFSAAQSCLDSSHVPPRRLSPSKATWADKLRR